MLDEKYNVKLSGDQIKEFETLEDIFNLKRWKRQMILIKFLKFYYNLNTNQIKTHGKTKINQ